MHRRHHGVAGEELRLDRDALVSRIANDEIEVGFVGFLNTWAQQAETLLRVYA